MDKKIVFFDIDGTIYRYSTGMPKDTIEAINKLKENGHIPVICTGRTKCMVYPGFLKPGFTHIVAGGGTYVEIDNKEVFLKELDKEEGQKVVDAYLKYNFIPVAEGIDNVYLGTDMSDITDENISIVNTYREKMPEALLTINDTPLKISKVSALFTNHSDMEGMIREFEDEYNIINHHNHLLELIPKPYNKAIGIEQMIEALHIPWENTYAFGDSFNDYEMLEYVKYGCVMGNGDEELKEKFQYVTDDFDKGGITKGLQMFNLI